MAVTTGDRGSIGSLLKSYPRTRLPLTPAHRAIHEEEYKANRGGRGLMSSLAQRLEKWMHRQLAQIAAAGCVLEIGAGTLNHLPYETASDAYDVVEPFTALYRDSDARLAVRRFYADITEVPSDDRYDRIISVATLEHLVELPINLAASGLLLARNGVLQAGIPSEGGFLWGLAWRCSTGLSYRLRTGLDYGVLMRHEHVNSAA